MCDVLIKAEGVSKKFCKSLRRSLWYGLQDLGREVVGSESSKNELRKDEFWAVKDIGFELKRGECLGLIGCNGAGKTTLLRMLNGLIKPDQGRIEMRGRVGALIALGAGFNPLLTGRENIYVNASVLGLGKREIDEKLDEIIDFSELADFIDTPVQNYSSGMQVRLGFSVATILEPDVLLLDEVLAVGDAAFRFKCHRKISQVLKRAAVIFVSHDMPHIARISTRALVLGQGKEVFSGNVPDAIDVYRRINEEGFMSETGFVSLQRPVTELSVRLSANQIQVGSPLGLDFTIVSEDEAGTVFLRINIFTLAGSYAADCVIDSSQHRISLSQGLNHWHIELASLPLKAGRYQLAFSLTDRRGDFLAVSYKCDEIVVVGGQRGTVADCQLSITYWHETGSVCQQTSSR